jgi:hypothetical protein
MTAGTTTAPARVEGVRGGGVGGGQTHRIHSRDTRVARKRARRAHTYDARSVRGRTPTSSPCSSASVMWWRVMDGPASGPLSAPLSPANSSAESSPQSDMVSCRLGQGSGPDTSPPSESSPNASVSESNTEAAGTTRTGTHAIPPPHAHTRCHNTRACDTGEMPRRQGDARPGAHIATSTSNRPTVRTRRHRLVPGLHLCSDAATRQHGRGQQGGCVTKHAPRAATHTNAHKHITCGAMQAHTWPYAELPSPVRELVCARLDWAQRWSGGGMCGCTGHAPTPSASGLRVGGSGGGGGALRAGTCPWPGPAGSEAADRTGEAPMGTGVCRRPTPSTLASGVAHGCCRLASAGVGTHTHVTHKENGDKGTVSDGRWEGLAGLRDVVVYKPGGGGAHHAGSAGHPRTRGAGRAAHGARGRAPVGGRCAGGGVRVGGGWRHPRGLQSWALLLQHGGASRGPTGVAGSLHYHRVARGWSQVCVHKCACVEGVRVRGWRGGGEQAPVKGPSFGGIHDCEARRKPYNNSVSSNIRKGAVPRAITEASSNKARTTSNVPDVGKRRR